MKEKILEVLNKTAKLPKVYQKPGDLGFGDRVIKESEFDDLSNLLFNLMNQENINLEIRINGNDLLANNATISLPFVPLPIRLKNYDKENPTDQFDENFIDCVIFPLQIVSEELRFKIVGAKKVSQTLINDTRNLLSHDFYEQIGKETEQPINYTAEQMYADAIEIIKRMKKFGYTDNKEELKIQSQIFEEIHDCANETDEIIHHKLDD